jgi:tetratricopeptide (TPR) repeat protein
VETALGEFPKAMTFLDRAARSAPRSSWVRAWRGVSRSLDIRRRRRGDLRQALKDLDAAMKLGASAQFVAPWRAELRHDLDDREGALADLALIAPDHDSHLWARVERGEILCELGRTPEALSEFNRLTRENPGAAWAWALRGRTKATTGRAREGLRDLDRAVKLAPRSAAARAWRSEALRLLGRYRLALRDLDCAVRRDPRYTLAWIWRGRLRLVRGQAAPALRDFNRALSLDERYRLAFAWRAEALFKLGRMKAAVRDMREAAPLDLSRTWNSVSREGELAASARREASYWSDLQECLRSRAADRWARAFVRAALKTGPAPAEPRQ